MLSIMKNDLLSKEHWEIIQQLKENFFDTHSENLLNHPQLNPDIASSWIRSYNMKVNPYNEIVGEIMSQAEYEKILEENRVLIETIKPLVNIYPENKLLGP